MLFDLYHRWIGRFIFRKLNFLIGLLLLVIFCLLGLLIYYNSYQLLEEREQELLDIRTKKFADHLLQSIEDFKQETALFYMVYISSHQQQDGGYKYFLPYNIPFPGDQRLNLIQENYFRNKMKIMTNQNLNAKEIFIYRVADLKMFHVARNNRSQLKPDFNFQNFFDQVPNDYTFPFIGKIDSSWSTTGNPVPYIMNPIFDFNSIHHDNAHGYLLMTLDTNALLETFYSELGEDSRLVIRQGEEILLDNQPALKLDEKNSGFLTKSQFLNHYDIEVIGMKDKSIIESKLKPIQLFTFSILFSAWGICVFFVFNLQQKVNKRFSRMVKQFKRVQENPFTKPLIDKGNDEISDFIHQFNEMTIQLQDHIQRVYVAEYQKQHAEYYALKMQINPHFLYNTLESLRMQAVMNHQTLIGEKIYILGQLFRWILKSKNEVISIEEEIHYTEYYLDLLMLGRSKSIALQIESEHPLKQISILKFSLQPIIENAITHGQLEKTENPTIALRILVENDIQWIEILNNGKGLSFEEQSNLQRELEKKSPLQNQHLGLKNIHERIRAYFGNSYGLSILQTDPGEGFGVCMKLPYYNKIQKEY